jgi:hypothetical protein
MDWPAPARAPARRIASSAVRMAKPQMTRPGAKALERLLRRLARPPGQRQRGTTEGGGFLKEATAF